VYLRMAYRTIEKAGRMDGERVSIPVVPVV
jgi:hypothetical protein